MDNAVVNNGTVGIDLTTYQQGYAAGVAAGLERAAKVCDERAKELKPQAALSITGAIYSAVVAEVEALAEDIRATPGAAGKRAGETA